MSPPSVGDGQVELAVAVEVPATMASGVGADRVRRSSDWKVPSPLPEQDRRRCSSRSRHDGQVEPAVAVEVAGHDRGDVLSRRTDVGDGDLGDWKVPSPLPSKDRDTFPSSLSDGQVELAVAGEVPGRDRTQGRYPTA